MNTSSISKAVQGMAVWIKLVITQNALLTLGCNTGSNLGKVVIIANALWSDILSVSLYTLSYFKMCKRKSWNFMFLHTKSKSLGRKMVYFMFLFCFFIPFMKLLKNLQSKNKNIKIPCGFCILCTFFSFVLTCGCNRFWYLGRLVTITSVLKSSWPAVLLYTLFC